MISPGVYNLGIPDVTMTLERTDAPAPEQTVLTQIDGSYQFTSLPAGTYTLVETQPQQYLSGGKDTAGSLGGQASTDNTISQIVLPAGQNGTEYDFGEWLLAPGLPLQAAGVGFHAHHRRSRRPADPRHAARGPTRRPFDRRITRPRRWADRPCTSPPSATITHAGGGNLASLTVTIANLKDGSFRGLRRRRSDDRRRHGRPVARAFPQDHARRLPRGVLTLTGIDSASDYQSLLQSIQYEDTAASPDTSPRTLPWWPTTRLPASNTATTTITITPSGHVSRGNEESGRGFQARRPLECRHPGRQQAKQRESGRPGNGSVEPLSLARASKINHDTTAINLQRLPQLIRG